MTFDPPSQPPAGWYPDPHRPGEQRWWDGRQWHERWVSAASPEGLPDIGAWLNRSFTLGFRRWKAIAIATAITSGIGGLLISGAAAYLLDGVVIYEDEVVGWSNDRLPLAIALVLVGAVLSAVGTLAVAALMLRTVDRDEQGGTVGGETSAAWRSIGRGFAVLPRALGWMLLLGLGALVIVAVLVGITIVILPIGILLILAAIPGVVYVGVRLAFLTQAIVDRPGAPYERSWDVSRGRFWPTFGRVLLLGVLVWLISAVIQSVAGLVSGTGLQGFGENDIVTGPDGAFVSFDLGSTVDLGPLWLIAATVSTIAVAVFAGGVGGAGFAILYRSRNPAPDESFA